MNWYKKSQKMPTIEEITWAIDKIIAERYEFSVEELQQASDRLSSNQQWGQKAAQSTKTKKYPRPAGSFQYPGSVKTIDDIILNLIDKGLSTRDVASQLNMSTPEVNKILKKYFPSKSHMGAYLSDKYDQDILDTYQEKADEMEQDFNIYGVTTEEIGEIHGITSKYVYEALKYNDISLHQLSKDRGDRIAEYIAEIVKDFGGKFKIKDIISEFYKRHNFKLSRRRLFLWLFLII